MMTTCAHCQADFADPRNRRGRPREYCCTGCANAARAERNRPASRVCRCCQVDKPRDDFRHYAPVCIACADANKAAYKAARNCDPNVIEAKRLRMREYNQRSDVRERARQRWLSDARKEYMRDYKRDARAQGRYVYLPSADEVQARQQRCAQLAGARVARDVAHWLALFETRLRHDERMQARRADPVLQQRRHDQKERDRRHREQAHELITNAFIRHKLRKSGWIAPHQPVPSALFEAMRPLLLIRRELEKSKALT